MQKISKTWISREQEVASRVLFRTLSKFLYWSTQIGPEGCCGLSEWLKVPPLRNLTRCRNLSVSRIAPHLWEGQKETLGMLQVSQSLYVEKEWVVDSNHDWTPVGHATQ